MARFRLQQCDLYEPLIHHEAPLLGIVRVPVKPNNEDPKGSRSWHLFGYLFLSKTKIKSPKLEKIKNKLAYENLFCVDLVGKVGGLALM